MDLLLSIDRTPAEWDADDRTVRFTLWCPLKRGVMSLCIPPDAREIYGDRRLIDDLTRGHLDTCHDCPTALTARAHYL